MTRIVRAGLIAEREGPVMIEEVRVDPPGPGEVRVAIRATGLCHSDLTASRDAPIFPVVLGHEEAGVVDEVGTGVEGLAPGTSVVISFRVPCGRCLNCLRGREPWCEHPRGTAEPRVHRLRDGAPVVPFLRVGSFCPYVVVPATGAIPIDPALSFEHAALLGCGIATGVGAALFDAKVEPGMDVAVFGLGGVGLNVVQGAALALAREVIAVDLLPEKLEPARSLSATRTLQGDADTVERVLKLTGGRGVDVSFEVMGHPEVMAQALGMLAPGGTLMVLGAASREALLSFAPRRFMSRQQTIRGDSLGACRPPEHYPLFARWALDGRLQVAPLISRTLHSLEEVNDAFAALRGQTTHTRRVPAFRYTRALAAISAASCEGEATSTARSGAKGTGLSSSLIKAAFAAT